MANKISIGKKLEGKVIKKELHSQFIEFLGSCISDGVWVGTDSEIPNYNGIRKAAVDALAKIESITVPSSVISVEGLSEDKSYTVRLSDYVSSGVKIVSDTRLQVTVKIASASTKTVHISSGDIKINNIPSGYNVVLEGSGIDVIIVGMDTLLNSISSSDISCSIDASGLAVGTHSVSVSINAPDGCSVSGSSLVNVTVSAKQEETTTKADNTANTNNNPTQQTTAKQ